MDGNAAAGRIQRGLNRSQNRSLSEPSIEPYILQKLSLDIALAFGGSRNPEKASYILKKSTLDIALASGSSKPSENWTAMRAWEPLDANGTLSWLLRRR